MSKKKKRAWYWVKGGYTESEEVKKQRKKEKDELAGKNEGSG